MWKVLHRNSNKKDEEKCFKKKNLREKERLKKDFEKKGIYEKRSFFVQKPRKLSQKMKRTKTGKIKNKIFW